MPRTAPRTTHTPISAKPEAPLTPSQAGRTSTGATCNTPPSNHTTPSSDDHRDYAGIDTLHVSFGHHWTRDIWTHLQDRLPQAKLAAQDPDASPWASRVVVGNHAYQVAPKGASGQSRMAYVLQDAGVKLCIMDRPGPHRDTPNVRVDLGAAACLMAGTATNAIRTVRDRLADLGDNSGGRVSRCDWYADMAGLHVHDLVDPASADHIVSRGRRNAQFAVYRDGRKATGFQFGSGIHLRVYDKVRELERHPAKYAAWSQYQWAGEPPITATRVEFQLRREHLKSVGIDRLDDLPGKSASATAYLANRWLRVTAEPVDRRNPSRTPTHPAWIRAQEAFRSAWGRDAEANRAIDRSRPDLTHLWEIVAGCMETAAALRGANPQTFEDLTRWAANEMHIAQATSQTPRNVYARIEKKRHDLEAAFPLQQATVGKINAL